MVPVYSIVLFTVLAWTIARASGPDVKHCSDVTNDVNHTIIDEVKIEVAGLVYDDSYFPLAQQYGISGKKPEPENDYIYLDKEGKFPRDEQLPEAARAVIRSVTEETRLALQSRPGIRPYACVAVRCFQSTNTDEIILRISCVARWKTELPSSREVDISINGVLEKSFYGVGKRHLSLVGEVKSGAKVESSRPTTSSDIFFCDSLTSELKETIVEEVEAANLQLEYIENYEPLAEDYGFLGNKPDNEGDYIYLHKRGTYPNEKPLKEIARELTKSMVEEAKDALKSGPGRRPYTCAAYKCDQEDYVEFEIACVARKAIERN